ncbi:MAG: VOC family protein [Ferruginibacter sp.]
MDPIVPYLLLNGNAAEALAFYSKVLDGKIVFQQTYGESPMPAADEMKDKIMHATMQSDKLMLMISDCPSDRASTNGNSVSLSLNFSSVASIDKIFAAFSDGATITMELQDTFWGARFGMLTDKFGINWMFNHDKEPKDKI